MPDSTSLPRGRRVIFATAMALLPLVFFALVEGGLRLSGYGVDHPLFVPVEGRPERMIQNPDVARRYFSRVARVPSGLGDTYLAEKDSATYRIVVQGGSSAAGYPYYFGGSFSRMLQQRLQQTFPRRRIEVVNTGLAAINSYTLLDFADEIVHARPDAVLIYAGHNEYYGALGVGSSETVGRVPGLVRLYLRLQSWRIVQALRGGLSAIAGAFNGSDEGDLPGRTLMERMVGEQHIPIGSDLYRAGLEQFRSNLSRLLDTYSAAGIPVYISTIASNERDHAPFISEPGGGVDPASWMEELRGALDLAVGGDSAEAVSRLDALAETDSVDALVHYLRGRLLDGAGSADAARGAYGMARDRDQLRFRAPSDVNRIIEREAGRSGAILVDSESALRASSPGGVIDGTLMLEHLHPNLEGYFLIADAFYRALEESDAIGAWNYRVPVAAARGERLVTTIDSLYGEFRLRQLLGSWPFKAPGAFDRSLDTLAAHTLEDSLALGIHRGTLTWYEATDRLWRAYADQGDHHRALRATLAMIQQYPYLAAPYAAAGDVLLRQGRAPEALAYFGAAADLEDSAALRTVMGDIYTLAGRPDAAVPEYRRAVRLDPNDADASLKLGRSYVIMGDTAAAVRSVQALLQRQPGEPRALAALEVLTGDGE